MIESLQKEKKRKRKTQAEQVTAVEVKVFLIDVKY